MRIRACLFSCLLVTSGCGHHKAVPDYGPEGDEDGGSGEALEDLALPGGPQDLKSPFMGLVYAHSSTELFQVDPDTLAVTRLAAFRFTGLADQITDIAL